MRVPQEIIPKNKKPAGAFCASGPMSALCCETLCTPHRARRVAVMMMVAMRPRVHDKKVKKIDGWCQPRFFTAICIGRMPGRLGEKLAAAAGACWPAGIEVHGHFEMNGDAGLAVFQLFHANHLRDVLAVHGIVRRGIRER